jgi:hypothetical protein
MSWAEGMDEVFHRELRREGVHLRHEDSSLRIGITDIDDTDKVALVSEFTTLLVQQDSYCYLSGDVIQLCDMEHAISAILEKPGTIDTIVSILKKHASWRVTSIRIPCKSTTHKFKSPEVQQLLPAILGPRMGHQVFSQIPVVDLKNPAVELVLFTKGPFLALCHASRDGAGPLGWQCLGCEKGDVASRAADQVAFFVCLSALHHQVEAAASKPLSAAHSNDAGSQGVRTNNGNPGSAVNMLRDNTETGALHASDQASSGNKDGAACKKSDVDRAQDTSLLLHMDDQCVAGSDHHASCKRGREQEGMTEASCESPQFDRDVAATMHTHTTHNHCPSQNKRCAVYHAQSNDQSISSCSQYGSSAADDTNSTPWSLASNVISRAEGATQFLVLDPMCGVGTFPLAFDYLLRRYCPELVPGARIMGLDACPESIQQAQRNCARTADAQGRLIFNVQESEDQTSVALDSDCVDVIVVDPPWGHRHCTYAYINKMMVKWMSEWVRVLKPHTGVLALVTIRTRHFELHVAPILRRKFGVEYMTPPAQFDNKGFDNCKLYIMHKKTGAQAA